MEFITDITVTVDEANYEDPERLRKILQSYSLEKKGSNYQVRGTFEELEKCVNKLPMAKPNFSSVTHKQTCMQDEYAPTHVKVVDVSVVVIDYIQQKCREKLNKIQGDSFLIVTQPDLGAVDSKARCAVQLDFKPQHDLVYLHDRRHSDFVRQRFISFYQRTASDLQVTSVHVSPHYCSDLERKFPLLLFKPCSIKNEVTVMGHFTQIAKLKTFLSQTTQRSSKTPVNKIPAHIPGTVSSVPSGGHMNDSEDESCPICMEPIIAKAKKILQCKHSFCRDCLERAFDYKPVCPTCGALYGILVGTQPEGGTMNVTKSSSSLPGYEKYGTIIIQYYIPNGIQTEEHPNPGQSYEGTARTAYLPDSSEGRMILTLLKRAFAQRLIFTIGQSSTSGRKNTVTWNDIHHKTSTHGGPTQYGYPDPDYLRRVRDELKVKGIE
ncbi:uncharacterized protein si:dkey-3h3.3 [Mugil cephalus]|uniref:uncharacterized protein si:dkey-3h3.3 n=1 Tax=Mugil cephalus TaxID=48193 RepID=UPI001FB56FED|nr:uncharacterized protein si:dkey-3h3.3 [Mugil cephalus]